MSFLSRIRLCLAPLSGTTRAAINDRRGVTALEYGAGAALVAPRHYRGAKTFAPMLRPCSPASEPRSAACPRRSPKRDRLAAPSGQPVHGPIQRIAAGHPGRVGVGVGGGRGSRAPDHSRHGPGSARCSRYRPRRSSMGPYRGVPSGRPRHFPGACLDARTGLARRRVTSSWRRRWFFCRRRRCGGASSWRRRLPRCLVGRLRRGMPDRPPAGAGAAASAPVRPRRRLGGPARLLVEEVHRIATRHSVPYGVALAAGGMLALTNPSGGVAWP